MTNTLRHSWTMSNGQCPNFSYVFSSIKFKLSTIQAKAHLTEIVLTFFYGYDFSYRLGLL